MTDTIDLSAQLIKGVTPGGGRTVTTLAAYLDNNKVVNVKDYGAIGNGVADDTAALNAVFAAVTGTSARVYFPKGVYTTTTGITFASSLNTAYVIQGETEAGAGLSLVLIKYTGAAGAGTYVFKWLGMCNSVARGIAFSGENLAESVVWVDATNTSIPVGPTSDLTLWDRCGFVGPNPVGGMAMKIGHTGASSPQLDLMVWRDCSFATATVLGKSDSGIKIFGGGNIKNFRMEGGQLNGFQTLADYSIASGIMQFENVFMSGPTDGRSIWTGGGCEISLKGCSQEGGGSLVSGAGATGARASLSVEDTYFAAQPANDVVIGFAGPIFLKNSKFENNRTGTSLPLIVSYNSLLMSATSSMGSIFSFGNYFQNAANDSAHWPFQDGGGNKYPGFNPTTADYYLQFRQPLAFISFGDKGGDTTGTSIVPLRAMFPTGGEYFASRISRANDGGGAVALVAQTGFLNMLKGDTVAYRNEAGTNDVIALAHNTDDSIQVGGVLGIKTNRFVSKVNTLGYAAAMTPNASAGNGIVITATNGTAFTINAPAVPVTDQELTLTIRNTFGVLGAATWDAVFKMAAWVQPANGFSRSITFRYDGAAWIEIARTSADVPN